jgi:hypothetical protein
MKMKITFSSLDSDKDGIHFRDGRYSLLTNQIEDIVYDENNMIAEFIPYRRHHQ